MNKGRNEPCFQAIHLNFVPWVHSSPPLNCSVILITVWQPDEYTCAIYLAEMWFPVIASKTSVCRFLRFCYGMCGRGFAPFIFPVPPHVKTPSVLDPGQRKLSSWLLDVDTGLCHSSYHHTLPCSVSTLCLLHDGWANFLRWCFHFSPVSCLQLRLLSGVMALLCVPVSSCRVCAQLLLCVPRCVTHLTCCGFAAFPLVHLSNDYTYCW